MTFNDGAQLDSSRVSVGGGGGGGRGGKIAIGGGATGLIILVLTLLLGGDPSSVLGGTSSAAGQYDSGSAGTVQNCQSGAQANSNISCRIVGTVNSLDSVWGTELAQQTGTPYVQPHVQLFSGAVSTGCGDATTDVGPFYCSADTTAYFDTSFFDLLVSQYGSSGGPLAQEYVVAHEVGHHIQDQLGDLGRAQADLRGPASGSVRTELQADCYGGLWAHYAATIPAADTGQPFLRTLTDQDISDALSAAASVGDDRIEKASTGQVNPEGWTHGSSEQREKWFTTGYRSGEISACDTFSARDLSNPPALTG